VLIVNMRPANVAKAVKRSDKIAQTEFQSLAWSPPVLGFLHAARRVLDWKDRSLDRTIMGFILVYLHAKQGGGLSNCMRQSKAMAPDYSVRWWRERRLSPPDIDPAAFLKQRVDWRYKHGVVNGPAVSVYRGDARNVLGRQNAPADFDLILTSPPYCDITNYRYDNWIRLWMLGGPPHPDYRTAERYADRSAYSTLLQDVFKIAAQRSKKAIVYVRTDARPFTAAVTEQAVRDAWPRHTITVRKNKPHKTTQTVLFGDNAKKPGDIDLIAMP
jgi:hypothetical protein